MIPARSADTDADAERAQVELLRAAPVARRLHVALSLTATVVSAARRAIARAQPQASARDLDLRFIELHYGADVAAGLRDDLERRDRLRAPRS
jgi:broad specificity phosphatase PhoE